MARCAGLKATHAQHFVLRNSFPIHNGIGHRAAARPIGQYIAMNGPQVRYGSISIDIGLAVYPFGLAVYPLNTLIFLLLRGVSGSGLVTFIGG